MTLSPIRILIVEDEAAHVEAIRRALEGLEGTAIRVMQSLQEFRDQALDWGPDLALVDLNLPDGRATDILADPGGTRPFPIILMTSYGSEASAVAAMRAGAFDYLVKSAETFRTLPQTLEKHRQEWQLRMDGKRMHRELKASEAKYRSLAESSHDYIFRYDREGRHTYLNPAALAMLGVEARDVLGRTHRECNCSEDLCRFWETRIDQVFRSGQPLQLEFEFENRGAAVIHDCVLTPEFDVEGALQSVLGVSRDITERKRGEEELREAREFNEQIIRSAQEGVIVYDLELRYRVWNPYMERLSGLPASAVIGRHPLEVFPFLQDVKVFAQLELALLGQSADPFDLPYTAGSGQKARWISVTCAPLRNSRHRIIGAIATVREITARRRYEEKLRVSEAKNRALISAIPDIIFVNDRDGKFLAVHAKAEAALLYPQETFLHRKVRDVLPGPLAERFMEASALALASGSVQELDYSLAIGGEERHFEARIAPAGEESLLTLVRDITARRRADAERQQLQAQLQHAHKMESLGSLAGGVAHDMNNVLGAILGLASANLEVQPPDSPTYRAFDTISKAAVRGGRMVKGLLNFARQSPGELRELDMNAVLGEVVHLLERTTLSRVRLELELAEDLRPIRGDANDLNHALVNLCVNAVDAMPEGGLLTLRSRNVDNDWIEVQVEDTGHGMSREILAKAMDPFFTTKEVGKGTGLGLALVYSTVKLHQGQVEIQSEPGLGTRVRLRFPACEIAQEEAGASVGVAPKVAFGGLNVLVVDDDELVHSAMQAILEVLGHSVTTAPDGEEALAELAAGYQPDVVILDMNMPGLGGSGTLPRLRALRPSLPVFLATGRADQTAHDLARAHPHVTLLSKPFSMKELQQHLEALARA